MSQVTTLIYVARVQNVNRPRQNENKHDSRGTHYHELQYNTLQSMATTPLHSTQSKQHFSDIISFQRQCVCGIVQLFRILCPTCFYRENSDADIVHNN